MVKSQMDETCSRAVTTPSLIYIPATYLVIKYLRTLTHYFYSKQFRSTLRWFYFFRGTGCKGEVAGGTDWRREQNAYKSDHKLLPCLWFCTHSATNKHFIAALLVVIFLYICKNFRIETWFEFDIRFHS